MTPNSDVYLLKNIPLNYNDSHTIVFSSRSKQTEYFLSHTEPSLKFEKLSYSRVSMGVIKLPVVADNVYSCNYMMFRNTGYSNKWFYAYITDIEYISDGCTAIHFKIDNLQTWLYNSDWYIEKCYVERMHTPTDVMYSELCPEPIPLGETVFEQQKYLLNGEEIYNSYIVYSSVDASEGGIKNTVSVINGQGFSGYLYLANSISSLNDIVESLQKIQDDAITAVQIIPRIFANTLTTKASKITNNNYTTHVDGTVAFTVGTMDGYKPKNNKCFNFPYRCLVLGNQTGTMAEYAVEYLNNENHVSYNLYSEIGLNATLIAHINGYRGLGSGNHSYDVQCATFPQAVFNSDHSVAFEQEQLQARINASMQISTAIMDYGTSQFDSVKSALGGDFSKIDVSKTYDTAQRIIEQIANVNFLKARQANTPSTTHNLDGNSNLTQILGTCKPFLAVRTLTKECARIIDDYFTMFGYQVNRLEKPNLFARPSFTYVKTSSACITGSAPVIARNEIATAFNSGITFWRDGKTVGDYSQNNSV